MANDRVQESGWPVECREERCSYFTHYLRYGPASIPHAAFHVAEQECVADQTAIEQWLREHPGKDVPRYMLRRVERLEKEVRA